MSDRIDFGTEPWQAIPRRVLRDPRLSPRAKGGLLSLLSHEEGWVRSAIATLQRENDCGKKQAQAIMQELVAAGYAELEQRRGKDGRFGYGYVVRAWGPSSRVRTRSSPGTGDGDPVQSAEEVHPNGDPHKNLTDESVGGVQNIGKTRQPNPAFDALAELHGGTAGLSRQMAKTIGVALAGIKRATPNVGSDEIHRRAANYRWLSWNREKDPPSAQSLAKWWADCSEDPAGRRPDLGMSPASDPNWIERLGEADVR